MGKEDDQFDQLNGRAWQKDGDGVREPKAAENGGALVSQKSMLRRGSQISTSCPDFGALGSNGFASGDNGGSRPSPQPLCMTSVSTSLLQTGRASVGSMSQQLGASAGFEGGSRLSFVGELDGPGARRGSKNSKVFGRDSLKGTITAAINGNSEPHAVKQSRKFRAAQSQHNLEAADFSQRCCEEALRQIQAGETVDLEIEFDNLFKYKNHWLHGRLLHFVIWYDAENREEDAANVRMVLAAGADLNSYAYYQRGRSSLAWLEAIHIAAGLGHVPCMQALLDFGQDEQLANRYCYVGPAPVGDSDLDSLKYDRVGWEPFYAPIHDAAYTGQVGAVHWLLEHGADASAKNIQGKTPLHWLVYMGLDNHDDLADMVQMLITHKASLEVDVYEGDMTPASNHLKCRSPLEMAALPGSQYPASLMYLLLPSYQAIQATVNPGNSEALSPTDSISNTSFLRDLSLVSSLNSSVVETMCKQLLAAPDRDFRFIRAVQADSQADDAVTLLAHLVSTAPVAAGIIFDVLLERPEVRDQGHHPIARRVSFWGIINQVQMRTAYQPDSKSTLRDGRTLKWPEWKFDSAKELHEQTDIAWHHHLVREPSREETLYEYVQEAETKCVMMPNLFNLDLLMALARTPRRHNQLFGKLVVKGLIHCLWHTLVSRVIGMKLTCQVMELFAFLIWGLTPGGSPVLSRLWEGTGANSSLDMPVIWSLLVAGIIRDFVNLFCWMHGYCWKLNHWQAVSGDIIGDDTRLNLKHLWRLHFYFLDTSAPLEMLFGALKMALLFVTFGTNDQPEMSKGQQQLLATVTVLQFWRVTFTFRVLTSNSKKLLIFSNTLRSRAIIEMFFVSSLVFASLVFAFVILQRADDLPFALVHLYRGLIFGDGDSFSNTGLEPEEDNRLITLLMTVGTLIFNVVILNLVIAIYTNEYQQLDREAELLFQQERVRFSCKLLLSGQKLRVFGRLANSPRFVAVLRGFVAISVPIISAIWWHLQTNTHRRDIIIVVAVLTALVQLILEATMIQSTWFHDTECEHKEDYFLWLCHQASLNRESSQVSAVLPWRQNQDVEERLVRLDDKMRSLEEGMETVISELRSLNCGRYSRASNNSPRSTSIGSWRNRAGLFHHKTTDMGGRPRAATDTCTEVVASSTLSGSDYSPGRYHARKGGSPPDRRSGASLVSGSVSEPLAAAWSPASPPVSPKGKQRPLHL
eukprot:TRINITY_DN123697_c0_g1_i1.p1 TRINITY_DN123697_c0_g1~~TRINITY_DN123697_c0_g1_i1.p1  ORF type:complete len:1202 (+),score=244.69 TRINITY_DN123697_c0_g1_i1:42-3647(+)